MQHKHKKKPVSVKKLPNSKSDDRLVRGSGFTYDEAAEKTDRSIAEQQVKTEQVVELPNLGRP